MTDNKKEITVNGDEQAETPVGEHQVFRFVSFGDTMLSKADAKQSVDPFKDLYNTSDSGLKILRPPYNRDGLAMLPDLSEVLGVCISAMKTNIPGFGWELRRYDDPNEETEPPAEAEAERKQIHNFMHFINADQDIVGLLSDVWLDVETFGEGFIEVVRSEGGDIAELYRIPAISMRITERDQTPTEFTQMIRDYDAKLVPVTRKKKFRRFVQMIKDTPDKKLFFKEFGDPRKISPSTGKAGSGDANEVIHIKIPSTYTAYGIPRWAGVMVNIMGSRKAEEVNYYFFENKSIPPMIVTISGGALTEESMNEMKRVFEQEIKGLDNFHKILLLEAIPHSASDIPGEKVSPVRIDVKPLTEFIQKDALFREYRADNRKKIRSSFKLPPIFTGDSDDYTRATAYESARVAEEQAFRPERRNLDYLVNRLIFTELKINYWEFKLLGPKTTAENDIVTALGLIKEGLPVGVLQEAAAELRNVPKGKIDQELYKTTLIEHQAEAAAKNRPEPLITNRDTALETGEESGKSDQEDKVKKAADILTVHLQGVVDEMARTNPGLFKTDHSVGTD